jgi:hypothetical protein
MDFHHTQSFSLNQATLDSSFKKCRQFFDDMNKLSKFELINKKRGQLYQITLSGSKPKDHTPGSPKSPSEIQTEP